MAKPTLRTPLCDLLGCEYPIMLAGMGSGGAATPPELVAAVCNAGGFGVKGISGFTPEQVRTSIRRTRELTDRPFGIDTLLPASRADVTSSRDEARERIKQEYPKHWAWIQELRKEHDLPDAKDPNPIVGVSSQIIEEQVEVVLEERVPLFAAALGDPSWIVPKAHAVGTKVLGLVGSARNAMRQMKSGVDIIVAQGYEAGGHTGRIANFPLIPEVVDLVSPTPVVAAGGIADGRAIAAALCLGAVGVWVGTAFLFSEETRIGPIHQRQLLQGQTDDFIVSRTYTGKTARGYKNAVKEAWEKSGLTALPMPLQGVLLGDFTEAARLSNRWDLDNNAAGQVAGRLTQIKPAKQIMEELVQGTVELLSSMQKKVVYSTA